MDEDEDGPVQCLASQLLQLDLQRLVRRLVGLLGFGTIQERDGGELGAPAG